MKKKMSLAQFTSKLDNGGYASATAARRALGRAQELSTQDITYAREAVDNHFQVPPAAPDTKKKPTKSTATKKAAAAAKAPTKKTAPKAAPKAAPAPTPVAPVQASSVTATVDATPAAKPTAKKRSAKRSQLAVLLEQRKTLATTTEILEHLKTTTECLASGSLRLKNGEDVIPAETLEPLLLSVREVFKNAGTALAAAGLMPKTPKAPKVVKAAPAVKAPSPSKAKSQANGKSTHAAAMAANATA